MPLPVTVKFDVLRELVAAGSVRSATLVGQRGGYAVSIRTGRQQRLLANKAGAVRLFARLDTAAKELRELGLTEFAVNVAEFESGRLRPARPDRATGLKRAHQVAEHDRWFRGKVRATLESLGRGEETLLDHDRTFNELRAFAEQIDAVAARPYRVQDSES